MSIFDEISRDHDGERAAREAADAAVTPHERAAHLLSAERYAAAAWAKLASLRLAA